MCGEKCVSRHYETNSLAFQTVTVSNRGEFHPEGLQRRARQKNTHTIRELKHHLRCTTCGVVPLLSEAIPLSV